MLSLIEVKCPHCGAKGQIMLPPAGAIIVGPCPECQGLVVVFCGQVLPLKREVMLSTSLKAKRDHLMSVLTDFIRERVGQVVAENDQPQADHAGTAGRKILAKKEGSGGAETSGGSESKEPASRSGQRKSSKSSGPITDKELETFLGDDLRLIDKADYFKAIFG